MRITQGQFKNRELKTPKGSKTRPSSGKVRERLFDILRPFVENAEVLDLFAGSGSLGIEALSRGAKSAAFVEKDRSAASCIRENLSTLGIRASLFQTDALLAIRKFGKKGEQFDLIFLDPPYALDLTHLLDTLPPLLKEGGILVIEQGKKATLSPIPDLTQTDKRVIGDTQLLFFQHC